MTDPSQNHFPWPIHWKYSARSRRLSLRIDPRNAGIILSLPKNFPQKKAFLFLEAHREWIETHLDSLPPLPSESGTICIEGQDLPIIRIPALSSFRPKLYPDKFVIRQNDPHESVTIEAFLKSLAKARLPTRFHYWSDVMELKASRITLRDAKTRWGSCSAEGSIMLNWRLILAPRSVQDYVIIHELSHLKHFNHSADFWHLVEKYCPNEKNGRKESEKWLKIHGIKLQRTV